MEFTLGEPSEQTWVTGCPEELTFSSSLVFLSVFRGCGDESGIAAGPWLPASCTAQVSTVMGSALCSLLAFPLSAIG